MLTILFAAVLLFAFGSLLSLLDHKHVCDVVTGLNAEYRMNALQLRNI